MDKDTTKDGSRRDRTVLSPTGGVRATTGDDGLGLRFDRCFTTEGRHPYDEVEWERRDAVISDWKTGEIAFEQRDVEFPTAWSMNATNIVSQKYFRGPLGTPQRESSVKQMIDRVADTITGWGTADGYFADDEAAAVFNAELKHLLVHQKAAFNSPVWFNCGVEETPQCSACQPWDSLVATPQGAVPIGQLVDDGAVGAKVFDSTGVTQVVAVKHNGRKEVRRINLKNGARLDVTGDHLVWRASRSVSGGPGFVAASSLRPGDRLEWHRTYSWGSGEVSQQAIHEAALAGWLQSDGFVGQYDHGTNRSLTIEALTVTSDEHAWVLKAIDGVFPDVHKNVRDIELQDDTLDGRRVRLYGEVLRDYVQRWDLLTRGPGMRVPEHLQTAPLPVVAAYLRSMFQAEGYVTAGEQSARIGLDMVCEELVTGLQSLLNRFGIFSRVRFKDDAREDRLGCWSLTINSLPDRRIFHDEIGFVDVRKADKLADSLTMHGIALRGTKTLTVDRIEDRGEMDVYDIQTESGEYLSHNLRVHNCFILSVEDKMSSILNWYVEEGTIFKGGSGSGVNLSDIRSSVETLRGGGEASGPVSFMRGADASAGTIKSGGKTRRAAKMVILNVDHPDIEEFIWCKQREEDKSRALEAAGFDMTLDGRDSASVQYQNANNSVRVTDEFMQAVVEDAEFALRKVTTGEVAKTMPARQLMRQISEAAWACADPGVQYDTTINDWHTTPNAGRINGSNPCFPGSARVHTDKGLVPFAEIVDRVNRGETFDVYTHDVTNVERSDQVVHVTSPEAFMITGRNPIVKLRLSNGAELRCTPGHKIFTTNRGYVPAEELTPEDDVRLLDLPTPAVAADLALPEAAREAAAARRKGDRRGMSLALPDKWSEEMGHYLGWLTGDGSVSGDTVATIYGSDEDREHILPRHLDLVTRWNADRAPKVSVQTNGTAQLRQSRRAIRAWLRALGVTDARAAEKRVLDSVFQAPTSTVAAYLRGLFDADGCVSTSGDTRYVGLGSRSEGLLRDVQMLLSTFGITGRTYRIERRTPSSFSYRKVDGTDVTYEGAATGFDLRITGSDIERFAAAIGFEIPRKAAELREIIDNFTRYRSKNTARLVDRRDDGFEVTYNLSEPRNHSYVVDGVVVRNCSEYMHLDNSACNLASLNLRKFEDGGTFDVESFRRAVEVVFTAQEIIVGNSSYPTEAIAANAVKYRQLGLGYANLGGLLMSLGLAYDSDAGRAWAGAITALMTGHAYRTSAEIAKVTGPFDGYAADREGTLRVLGKHRAAVGAIDSALAPADVLGAAAESWDDAVAIGEEHGVRNAQASVLAPTGCLVGGSLVATDRGLVRLTSLGDPAGAQWQELDTDVLTDEGPRQATKFYVNGSEAVVTVTTARGYQIQGTPQHRIKVVDDDGRWVWRRFGDLTAGDQVPLALGGLIGTPNAVTLPPLGEGHWNNDWTTVVPREMSVELAEFLGYFMGDGSLHAKGIRLCIADDDFDVRDRLSHLGKQLFNLEAHITQQQGYTELVFHSVRLVEWWEACGFIKHEPRPGHSGKGWHPHIPDAVLHSNDRKIYAGFLRGLYEADGTVTAGYPTWSTTSQQFSHDVQTLLLALGYPTTRKFDMPGWGDNPLAVLRLLNVGTAAAWSDEIGFLGSRKQAAVQTSASQQSARHDKIPFDLGLVDRLAPANGAMRRNLLQEVRRTGSVSRRSATTLLEATGDSELAGLLDFFYDTVASAELGEDELTYDISVPSNVTYVANGFVSHNTIGLMMDCDTTGIEPDLGLVKSKKLVGGGTMRIVNQTVPHALANLGYQPEQVEAIVAYIDDHATVEGAPALLPEHVSVFDCAMGERSIKPMGHIKMMAAAQPFLSGAISKCVTGGTLVPTEDGLVRIGSLHEGEAPDTFRDTAMEVASLGGATKTDAFYYGGVRQVHQVVLRSGHTVTGTGNHRVLVVGDDGPRWRYLEEIQPGEYVAVQYGTDRWAPLPARFDDFVPSPSYGSQKHCAIPTEMTEELAFLLGAYVSEGHVTRSNWTVLITNSVPEVRQRIVDALASQFGLHARIVEDGVRCPMVVASSKTLVEFLEYLGTGSRASAKRIPDAVLRSPRSMVLAFLQGLHLDAYATTAGMAKLGLCLDSPALLDDYQTVLTNLGIVTGRIRKWSPQYQKFYGEVYTSGAEAGRLADLVPFLEPDKAARAYRLPRSASPRATADVVPGVTGQELYDLLPTRPYMRNGRAQSKSVAWRFLTDPRTRRVSRAVVAEVAAIDGVVLPDWLRQVVDDGLHFSPVESVAEAGEQEVFDLSVPTTHAFVGNGIVNHNTVNLPETATVEDVEEMYLEGWRLGLKAIAIYRDNCKVAQPLSIDKKIKAQGEVEAAAPAATAAESGIVRRRLPKQRPSQTISFAIGDADGYVTAGEYPGDGLGEIFVKLGKQGSTLSGITDALAISVSLGLQYGVPLEAYISKFINTRFEPAGMTDDPDIRFATSLTDYIFRRLAIEYLPTEQRQAMGIYTTAERTAELDQGTQAPAAAEEPVRADGTGQTVLPVEPPHQIDDIYGDAPLCLACGEKMQRAGSCHVCPGCGMTSGCS